MTSSFDQNVACGSLTTGPSTGTPDTITDHDTVVPVAVSAPYLLADRAADADNYYLHLGSTDAVVAQDVTFDHVVAPTAIVLMLDLCTATFVHDIAVATVYCYLLASSFALLLVFVFALLLHCTFELLRVHKAETDSSVSTETKHILNEQLFVRGLTGKTKVVNISLSENLTTLKYKIHEVTGVYSQDQLLMYGGQILKAGISLFDQGIRNQVTIDLRFRLAGGMLIASEEPPPLASCDSSDDENDEDERPVQPPAPPILCDSSRDPSDDQEEPISTHPSISVIKTKIHSVAVQNAFRNSAAASNVHRNRHRLLLETRLSIQLNGKLFPITGDGHSAFRCIAKHISTEDKHLSIRQQCADYITANSELFYTAYNDDIYAENTSLSFETYVKILRDENGQKHSNGNWTPLRGQSLALDALSQCFRIGIDVYHFKAADKSALRITASFNRQCSERISLLLSGADHYDYIETATNQSDPPHSFSASISTSTSRKSRKRKDRRSQRPFRQTKIDQYLNGQVIPKACKPPAKQYANSDFETLRIMVHNVNGQSNTPTGAVIWAQMIDHVQSDITALIDTRIPESAELRAKASWTQMLPEYVTHHATTKPTGGGKVGGITFILSPKLNTATNNRYHDKYKMGVAMAVDLTFPGEHIFVIAAYWTTIAEGEHSEHKNSLWQRIKRQLVSDGSVLSPLEYIKHQIEDWTTMAKSKGWTVVLLGDLNSGWQIDTGQHGDCAPWAMRFDLTNQPSDYAMARKEPIVTFPRGKSHIDHILTSNYKLRCTNIVDTSDEIAFDKSDHLPLVVDFKCHNIRTPPSYTPTPERHIDITPGDSKLAEKYGQWMKDPNCPQHPPRSATPEELANYLDDLVAYAVSGAALATLPFRKKKFFHGWSPQLMSNIYHMQFLMGLKRQIDRWSDTRGWSPHEWIETALYRLHDRIRSTQKDTKLPPDTSSLAIDGFQINDWKREQSLSRFLQIFEHHRLIVKKRLHADSRMQDRMIISDYTKQNMKLYHEKKYKRMLSAIFGKYRKAITEITQDDGSVTLDPIIIHDTIEAYIRSIHHLNTSIDRNTDWIAGINGRDFLAGNEQVPQRLRDTIAKSFSKHKDNHELHSEMTASLRASITFDEFTAEIRSRPSGKSGGISGFTINMLKALPIELQSSIFDVMNDLWKRRADDTVIPESWFHRWICTVPKVKGVCDIKQIRPISLYEVLRKLWTSIINKRISAVWEKLGTLHASQHAYRLGMGTDTELLQLINVIEDSSQHNKEIILSEFDTAKAFDSVNKDLMIAAWMRLGVPIDVAKYLVKMDDGGLSIPKTPHAISVLGQQRGQPKTAQVFTDRRRNSTRHSVRGFTARDGIGQGDSPSANAWTAVFDILLCALDDIEEPPYLYHKRDDELAAVKPLAYADDLNTISPSLQHAQATADIVSAYNFITGFQTNVGKIRFTTNNPLMNATITVYDSTWTPCKKALYTKYGGKILGIPIDLTNKWTTLKKSITAKIDEICQPILHKKIGISPKLLAYTMVAIPAVVYKAKFLNFTIEQYTKLFAPIDALLRSVCHLQRSFPKHLLHITEKYGGLQLPDLVEQVQMHKMSSMYRALRRYSPALDSGVAILERCLRNNNTDAPITGNHQFDDFDRQHSWYRSVLQWQSQSEVQLEKRITHGEELVSLQTIMQHCRPANREQCLSIIKAYDINFLQDITAQGTGLFRERLTDHPVNVHLTPSIPAILNSEPNFLQIGKMYLNKDGQVEEYSGKHNFELKFRQWTSQRRTKAAKIGQFIHPSGYRTRSVESCNELLAHVHCLAEENLDGTTHGIKIIAIQPEKPPTPRQSDHRTIDTQVNSNLLIFTDGGRKEILSRRQLVFGEQFDIPEESVLTATGAIVLVRENKIEELYAVDGFSRKINDVHSFEAEEVPIITALLLLGERIRGATIFTDGESVYKKLQKARWKQSDEMHEDPYISAIFKLSTQLGVTISFTPGHAEKKKKRKDWTLLDKGNVAADWVTRGRFEDVFELYKQKPNMEKVHVINFNNQTLVSKLFETAVYTFAKGGFPIASYQLKKLHRTDRVNAYLTNRTAISTRHIDWTALSLTFSANAIHKSGKISKIMLSKMLYGKYDDSQYKTEKDVCPICREGTDNRDHLIYCRMTQHLWDIAIVENAFTPADQQLYERMHISSDQLRNIRRTIATTIRLDAFTRIGIFNQAQQNSILQSFGAAYVDADIGKEIRHEIEQQLAPWIRAMITALKLRNASKYNTRPAEIEIKHKEKFINYNIFDELSDQTSDEEIAEIKVEIVNRHTETTTLLFSPEQFYDYVNEDTFLTNEYIHPTTIVSRFPQDDTACLSWIRFRSHNHSMWITPLLQTTHMTDDEGRLRPQIISAQGSKPCGIRHISSNHSISTKFAVRLMLAIEDSMQQKRLPSMIDIYLRSRYGSILSSDLCMIQDRLSAFVDSDKLLHYLNWNQRAFSIILAILESSDHDTPDDVREYSWADVDSTLVDTSKRLHIIVTENNSTTIVYFTQQPVTRRGSRNSLAKQSMTLVKHVEHNLASVKNFHHSRQFKLSTFHLDTAKTSTITDSSYLTSVHNSISLIRQSYEEINFRTRKLFNRATLQRIIGSITLTRSQLNRTLLSRQRYIRLRRYLGTIQIRIQRIVDQEQNQRRDHQSSITQYFSHSQNVSTTAQDKSSLSSDNDKSEDYRGESD
jgi:hypothetical protein